MKNHTIFITTLFLAVFLLIPGFSAQAGTIIYSYDSAGRLSNTTFQNDMRISYLYDASGNIISKKQGSVVKGPKLTVNTSGIKVTLSWTKIAKATSYALVYAPYPYKGTGSINSVYVGNTNSLSVELSDKAAFYVAVIAYTATGTSDYSNIEYFILSL